MTNRLQALFQRARKAMSPSWDSLTDLEAYQTTLKLLLICAAPVGALLAASGAGWWTWYNTKIEKRISELRSANDNEKANAKAISEKERADQLNDELVKTNQSLAETKKSLTQANQSIADLVATSKDTNAKVTDRLDLLTEEVKGKLVARLKKLPPQSVGFGLLDDSAANFGAAIEQIMADSGCLSPARVIGGIKVSGVSTRGIVVQWIAEDGKPVAAELVAAFKDAGIPDVVFSDSRRFLIKTGTLAQVSVGAK
ncbi:MAG TPA: hypothetical protein VH107_01950 [Lacipirellulaceae bacterium]|jgi:hypothetical protein|nr:hypothetical protein [Lacipirellulaceae bacterium]